MRLHQLQYSVQVAGNRREEYIAAFVSFGEAVNYTDITAAKAHESGSRQTFNVWNEQTNTRVHVVYAPAEVDA